MLSDLFWDVIFDIVSGMLEETMVIKTIKTENAILYIPSSVVVIILLRYILYMKPKNLVKMLNIVSVNRARINFFIISPPKIYCIFKLVHQK